MDLHALRIFKAIADSGSFSAAAHALNYAQSNISTRIQQLEMELQCSLFYRNNRGIDLTPKGKLLLEYADRILALADVAATAMQEDGVARGPLSIGSMETVASVHLPRLLAKYHHQYPQVRLSLTTGNTSYCIEQVLGHDLDGAFVAGPIHHPDLVQKAYCLEHLLLVGDMAHGETDFWNNLAKETLLVFPYGCSYRAMLEAIVNQPKRGMDRIIEFNSLGAMLASICAGLGIGLLRNPSYRAISRPGK